MTALRIAETVVIVLVLFGYDAERLLGKRER